MRCDLVPKLDAYLARFEAAEFSYGIADCAIFAGGWVKEATGVDPLEQFGKWDNLLEATNAISLGGGTLLDAVDLVLPPRPRITARLGDIVAFQQSEDSVMTPLGICLGHASAFLSQRGGYSRIKTLACVRAWSVL